jgi:hypothetical protein
MGISPVRAARWDGASLTVRSSGCAAVGVVTELVDVHATLRIGIVAGDVPRDSGGGRLGGLLKGNGAGDLRVTSNECNCGGSKSSAGGLRLSQGAHPGVCASWEETCSAPPLARKLGIAGYKWQKGRRWLSDLPALTILEFDRVYFERLGGTVTI